MTNSGSPSILKAQTNAPKRSRGKHDDTGRPAFPGTQPRCIGQSFIRQETDNGKSLKVAGRPNRRLSRFTGPFPRGLHLVEDFAGCWEEDPVRDHLWWLMKYESQSHRSWCACIGLLPNGSFRGFLAGDPSGDEDNLSAYPAFRSFEEARKILEVEAKLDGLFLPRMPLVKASMPFSSVKWIRT